MGQRTKYDGFVWARGQNMTVLYGPEDKFDVLFIVHGGPFYAFVTIFLPLWTVTEAKL